MLFAAAYMVEYMTTETIINVVAKTTPSISTLALFIVFISTIVRLALAHSTASGSAVASEVVSMHISYLLIIIYAYGAASIFSLIQQTWWPV